MALALSELIKELSELIKEVFHGLLHKKDAINKGRCVTLKYFSILITLIKSTDKA